MKRKRTANPAVKRVLSLGMKLVQAAAAGGVLLPWLLLAFTEPFAARLRFTLFYAFISVEKIWAMFFRMPRRYRVRVEGDWSAALVGLAYSAVLYAALIEFYVRRGGGVDRLRSVIGTLLYALALAWRYWTFRHLAGQWAIHVDETGPDQKLVTTGPYGIVRHPLYLGAMIEPVAISLVFGSGVALAIAGLAFAPLVIARARLEERYVRRRFGAEYEAYAASTRAFVPRPGGIGSGHGGGGKTKSL